MSLSKEPALSVLKNELVCGYRDISNESYAGFSGKHKVGDQAINTTNGAGPHNLQSFVIASDGTVLTCLPGYWNPSDLVEEVAFAAKLHDVWTNTKLSTNQKRQYFKQMHLAHTAEHSPMMVQRSRMQVFDMEHEAKYNLNNSDTMIDHGLASAILSDNRMAKTRASRAFKTTDQLMHERMAKRPFLSYNSFDVAQYANYGRPLYDKNEDFRNTAGQFVENGKVVMRPPDKAREKELMGKVPENIQRRRSRSGSGGGGGGGGVNGPNRFGENNMGHSNTSTQTNNHLWGQSNQNNSRPVLWGAN